MELKIDSSNSNLATNWAIKALKKQKKASKYFGIN